MDGHPRLWKWAHSYAGKGEGHQSRDSGNLFTLKATTAQVNLAGGLRRPSLCTRRRHLSLSKQQHLSGRATGIEQCHLQSTIFSQHGYWLTSTATTRKARTSTASESGWRNTQDDDLLHETPLIYRKEREMMEKDEKGNVSGIMKCRGQMRCDKSQVLVAGHTSHKLSPFTPAQHISRWHALNFSGTGLSNIFLATKCLHRWFGRNVEATLN